MRPLPSTSGFEVTQDFLSSAKSQKFRRFALRTLVGKGEDVCVLGGGPSMLSSQLLPVPPFLPPQLGLRVRF